MTANPPKSGRLFSEHAENQLPADVYLAEIDGASRGNPGPASYGVVLRAPNGRVEWELGKPIGVATNNVAEYYALLTALEGAASRGLRSLRVRSDSLLLVRQMQGRYKVKSADLRPLHERAAKAARSLQYFAIEYIPREQNRAADRLANHALDNSYDAVASHREKSSPRAMQSAGESAAAAREKPRSARNDGSVARSKRLVARYSNSALHLIEPLELQEGEEVEITIHSAKKRRTGSKREGDSSSAKAHSD
jgi:probable phosphoglycerate mutase